MDGFEYTLTGFDDFLERRRIVFVKPLPSTRVCGVCGVVPSNSLVLPCGHVVCHFCKAQIAKGDGKCPLDDVEFAEADVVAMTFKQSDLEQCCVLCIAGGEKCSFVGKLSELKNHLIKCGSDEIKCSKCQQSLVRSLAAEHCRQCPVGPASRQPVCGPAIVSVLEGLIDVRRDLEKIQERATNEKDDSEAVVNTANSLAERVASIERQLMVVQRKTNEDQCNSMLSVLKRAAYTVGPHRSASKQGNFIATCIFYLEDVNILDGKVIRDIPGSISILGGYCFKLYCKSSRERFYLTFNLLESGWEVCLEWPFSKKVTLILTHPTCMEKDIRLPVNMEFPSIVQPPHTGSINSPGTTKDVLWSDLRQNGFIIRKYLYVNVEIE